MKNRTKKKKKRVATPQQKFTLIDMSEVEKKKEDRKRNLRERDQGKSVKAASHIQTRNRKLCLYLKMTLITQLIVEL